MSELETLLADIEARASSATPGPWTEDDVRHFNRTWMTCPGCNDHAFIAHARTDIPRLVAALRIALKQAGGGGGFKPDSYGCLEFGRNSPRLFCYLWRAAGGKGMKAPVYSPTIADWKERNVPPFTRYNGKHEPCDVANGPCLCGAWHSIKEWEQLLSDERESQMLRRYFLGSMGEE